MSASRPPSRALLAAVALTALAAGGVLGWLVQGQRQGPPPQPVRVGAALLLPERTPLPAFRLASGERVLDGAALRGRWTLLFFGYIHCPDVCPTTLAVVAEALGRLPPAARARVGAWFVSVDPARDDPARAASYAAFFGQGIVGLSGERAAIDRLARAVGAYYELGEPDAGGGYVVNHSVSLFLVDPAGRFAGIVSPPLDAASLAATLERLAREEKASP